MATTIMSDLLRAALHPQTPGQLVSPRCIAAACACQQWEFLESPLLLTRSCCLVCPCMTWMPSRRAWSAPVGAPHASWHAVMLLSCMQEAMTTRANSGTCVTSRHVFLLRSAAIRSFLVSGGISCFLKTANPHHHPVKRATWRISCITSGFTPYVWESSAVCDDA